jgi:DNA repair protein RadD
VRYADDCNIYVRSRRAGERVMASICRDAVTQWNGRVLILAHVKELLEQAADKPCR